MNISPGVAGQNRGLERCAGKEIFQLRSIEEIPRAGGIRSIGSQESDAATGIAEGSPGEGVAMNFSAEFEGMLAGVVGDVINELSDGVRALKLGPLESTQAGAKISTKANARQPAGEWTGNASVQTIT